MPKSTTFRVGDDDDSTAARDEADSSPTTPGAGSNWLWLVELSHWNLTLELDFRESRLGADLQRHFSEVRFHGLEHGIDLPLPAGACDCITLNGVLERMMLTKPSARRATLSRLFAECRRVLRPGGCLYVGTGVVQVTPGTSRWRSLIGLRRPFIADRWLRRAGFKSMHSYYVDPCLDRAYVMVPATRRSLLARERALAACGGSGFRRMLAVRLGLPHALYPARIGLAYT
jgi:hypothetical protein